MDLKDLPQEENLIVPLFSRLSQLAKDAQADEVRYGKPFTHEVIVQADEDTPFQILVKVLYTCGQSEFNKLRLLNYKEKGYIPAHEESESVSKTLEYAYDDWCIARMADGLGEEKTAGEFYTRSQGWKHLLDPETDRCRRVTLKASGDVEMVNGSDAAARIVSSSCSTTRTVFPRSLS